MCPIAVLDVKLLDILLDHARKNRFKEVYLATGKGAERAVSFYKKHGFIITGRDATDTHHPLPTGRVIPEIEMMQPK